MNQSKSIIYVLLFIVGMFAITFQSCEQPEGNIVNTVGEFTEAMNNAVPGDKIVLANGIWEDAELLVNAKGTAENPIIVTAEDKGKVIFSGLSNLRISGEYVEVSGLVFKNGYTPSNEVIAFRERKGVYGNHCRLTEVVIDNFNNPERLVSETWVAVYGKNNRVDHCVLNDKRGRGVTMTIRMVDEACHDNNHLIDHNYFGFRQNYGNNGGETIRLGTSHFSLAHSGTTVEANYFDRCDGEHEIISNKSCGNVFKDNTFFECRGTLTYRHGNDNVSEGNFFFGNGKEHTGGIRIINERNKAINNYFSGLTGYRFRGAMVIMNGVPNSAPNRYVQVDGGVFSNNTFVNCNHVQLCAGSDEERSAIPVNTKVENNVFYNDANKKLFTVYDDISGIYFANNYLSEGVEPPAGIDIDVVEMNLVENNNGLPVPVSPLIKSAGCSLEKPVATKENTGVNWYVLTDEKLRFGIGHETMVEHGSNTLFNAVRNSKSGDILVLKDGEYINSKNIFVAHPLTIKAAHNGKATLFTEKNDMFVIQNLGALKLQGLNMSGALSPDMAGNCIIGTSRHSMNRNYKLIVEDCTVEDLVVNHSFDFIRVAKNTFADSVVIRNCAFKNITGSVASLNKENDDIGAYSAEYVIYENNTFEKVGKTVLNLRRGGTDESTFGPTLIFKDCNITNCGWDKRNDVKGSIYIHGVQVADISDSDFKNSAPFILHLTNGEPITSISNINIHPKANIESNSNDYTLKNLTHNN
ncbi:chondroitinase-B domain-containing protein [Draconibacterium sp.]|uniref:chondroitinase-B domain-containing protein n=1 Tax=Draconibacterium sp. TaxID=1965318 RepID=UPI00356505B8